MKMFRIGPSILIARKGNLGGGPAKRNQKRISESCFPVPDRGLGVNVRNNNVFEIP